LPAEDGVRFDDAGHLLQGFLAQFLADLGQGLPFRVTELNPPFDLVAQDAVFCDQVLDSQEESLVPPIRLCKPIAVSNPCRVPSALSIP
jgi:hypothetical protein